MKVKICIVKFMDKGEKITVEQKYEFITNKFEPADKIKETQQELEEFVGRVMGAFLMI
jgi:hypothetical protein